MPRVGYKPLLRLVVLFERTDNQIREKYRQRENYYQRNRSEYQRVSAFLSKFELSINTTRV